LETFGSITAHRLTYLQDGKPLYFSASFGVSYIHPEIGESLSQRHIRELINEVNQKMLLAKQLGKNRVVT
jgi:PleD family two-component response regulator